MQPEAVLPVGTRQGPAVLTGSPRSPRPTSAPGRSRWALRWEGALAVALVLMVLLGAATSPHFLTASNIFSNVCLPYGELVIMALPMTLVILSGEIDLSIASTLALSSSLVGYLWSQHWPMPLVILAALAAGLVCGVFNGALVTRVGLPSLAVTIGTMTLYEGISEIILGPSIITSFPAAYTTTGVNAFPGTGGLLSYSAVIFILLAVVFGVVLHATPFGRSVVAIGWNKEAAQFAGIRVKRVKTVLYMLSGLVGALAGVLYTFRLSTAEADNGTTLILPVVAVVLLGGVSIFGGKGTMVGVVLAVLVYCGLQSLLLLTNFNSNALELVTGALLLLSVVMPNGREVAARARRFARHSRTNSPDMKGGLPPASAH